jgi:hypothetical protein
VTTYFVVSLVDGEIDNAIECNFEEARTALERLGYEHHVLKQEGELSPGVLNRYQYWRERP